MTRKWYEESSIRAIAEAIREVDSDETKMTVADMPARIRKMGDIRSELDEYIDALTVRLW